MTQLRGQKPERGQSGAVLNKQTLSGKKLITFASTNFGSSSLTQSGSSTVKSSLSLNIIIWDLTIPTGLRTANNVMPWDEVLVVPFWDVYVDVDVDADYRWPDGPSLSDDQKRLEIEFGDRITPSTGASQTSYLAFRNYGSSEHTIYIKAGAKYLLLST